MPTKRLTDQTVHAIPAPASGRKQDIYYDDKLKGFGLRVTSATSKTFVVESRVKGKTRRVSLGKWGPLSTAQARERAKKLLVQMSDGIDPNKAKAAERAKGITLAEVFEEYMARKALRTKTQSVYEGAFRRCLSDWGSKRITDITRDMVEQKFRKLSSSPTRRGTSGRAQASQAMRLLSSLLNFAMNVYDDSDGKPLITYNPVKRLSHVQRGWSKGVRRQGVISNSELPAFFKAVMQLRTQTARDYFVFLVLTGLRRNEAAGLRWDEVRLEEKHLVISAHRTKNKREHPLPLPAYLYRMLERRREQYSRSSPFVFPGTGIAGHYAEVQSAVDSIVKSMGKKFMPHDLRRTFVTVAERLKIEPYALKRLLNHRDGKDVTDDYIITDIDRLREPMSLIVDFILNHMTGNGPAGPDNVLPFVAKAALPQTSR